MSRRTRSRQLPPGWYPRRAQEVVEAIREFELQLPQFSVAQSSRSVVVPHAGWAFSGPLAYAALSCLSPELECVAVIGGHLRPGDSLVAAPEDGFETPLGPLEAAADLRQAVAERLEVGADREADNSVEVQLPLVKHLMPRARVLYLRAPPDEQALRLAEVLSELGQQIAGGLAVVGSTDLTHYGPGFGFTSHGPAARAVEWVKQNNDRLAIDPLLALDARGALEAALRNRAACSMGAGASAAHFARLSGVETGRLVGYYTSYDVMPGDSIVGYAGIAFEDAA